MLIKKRIPFLLSIIVLGFIIIAGLAIHTYKVQKELYLEGVDKQLKLAAEAAELYLGNDFVDRYTLSNPPSNQIYQSHLYRLSAFAQHNDIQYIYLMVQDTDGIHIALSSATKDEIDQRTYDPFYTPYQASEKVIKGFEDKKAFFVSEDDQYGSFRSYCKYGLSPSGKVYMVGADIPLTKLDLYIDHLIRFYTYVFLILALLVNIIFYIYVKLFQNNRHLNKIALTDTLTKLYNRQKIDDELLKEQNRVEISDSYMCSCLLVDIDHFKSINDNFGHLEGDKILREVSQLMRDFFRSNDIIGR